MPINFFSCAKPINAIQKFGLIDPSTDTKKAPAYVDYKNTNEWQAEVTCNNRNDYQFIPVDNNKNITFPVSKKNCEAILFTKKTLCFVELKYRKSNKGWLTDCLKKFRDSAEQFENSHSNEFLKFNKIAYACNRLKDGNGDYVKVPNPPFQNNIVDDENFKKVFIFEKSNSADKYIIPKDKIFVRRTWKIEELDTEPI